MALQGEVPGWATLATLTRVSAVRRRPVCRCAEPEQTDVLANTDEQPDGQSVQEQAPAAA